MAKSKRRQKQAQEKELKRLSRARSMTNNSAKHKQIDKSVKAIIEEYPALSFMTVDNDDFKLMMEGVKPLKEDS